MLFTPPFVDVVECRTIVQDACAFLDGWLVAAERDAFAAHVSGCASCRATVARDRRYLDALRRAARGVSAPASLRARVRLDMRRPHT